MLHTELLFGFQPIIPAILSIFGLCIFENLESAGFAGGSIGIVGVSEVGLHTLHLLSVNSRL